MFFLIGAVMAGELYTVTLKQAQIPTGISATWTVENCNLILQLKNSTGAPVELDWMRSVYAAQGQAAVGLVPGTSSKTSSMISIPPMVVPPGGFAEEMIFRKDRLTEESGLCLFDAPSTATITLSISGKWLTQQMDFDIDLDELDRRQELIRLQEEAIAKAQQEIAAQAAERERQRKEAEDLRRASELAVCQQKDRSYQRRMDNTEMWRNRIAIAGGATFAVLEASALMYNSRYPQSDTASGLAALGLTAGAGSLSAVIPMSVHIGTLKEEKARLPC